MGYLTIIFLLLPGKHHDSKYKCFPIQDVFHWHISVRANSVITNFSEIECFVIDPSRAVTEKKVQD
jgi:hypothetical protein